MQIYFSSAYKILDELNIATSVDDFLLAIQYKGKDENLELLSLAINTFKVKAVLCIDNDIYIHDVHQKIKEYNRAFGKLNLLELKKQRVFMKDDKVDNIKYYLDYAVCDNYFSNELILKIIEGIYQEKMIYLSLFNDNPHIKQFTCINNLIKEYYNNTLFKLNNIRMFGIETLDGKRFLFFLGKIKLILQMKKIYILRGCKCSEQIDSILDNHIFLLPPNTNTLNNSRSIRHYYPDK